jgi:hypothetical protein
MRNYFLMLAAAVLLLPICALAQEEWYPLKTGTISFRIGYFMPTGNSDIWDENTADLTYEVSDFNNYLVGIEFNYFATRHFTVGVAIDYYKKSINSNYRDYVDDQGYEITQDITLEIVPVTGTFKFMPLGNGSPGYRGQRGSSFVPWIGAGIGIYPFRYEEFGEFIDFSDMSIYDGDFITEATAFGFHFAGGVVVPVGFDWDAFAEFRYAVVKGDLSEDFLGFDPIDLGGAGFIFGASYRF